MSYNLKENLKLKREIENLGNEIVSDIDHGECFYDKGMLDDFIKTLDKLKELSVAYYNSNRDEEDGDE